MENGGSGGHEGDIAHKFTGLAVTTNMSDEKGLFQVMKAVEAAEATIKQQVEENTQLRSELEKKIQELEKYKFDDVNAQSPHLIDNWDDHARAPHRARQSVSALDNPTDGIASMNNTSAQDPSNTVLLQREVQNVDDTTILTHGENHSESSKINRALKMLPRGQAVSDNAGFSQFYSPSTTFSPSRYQLEGNYDHRLSIPGHGLMATTEVTDPSSLLKQIRQHEEEILLLRKRITDYSIMETQVRNEKYVLEKRIAYMRLAFDQQQKDLIDAASKALSYRQDIIEENIRLTYALQAAQQERSTFVSSLMPVLAEYSLQPPVADAQSIVSNLKVLFKHLQEKLIVTEAKVRESQYQMAPWHTDLNNASFSQSPSYSIGYKNGLELVAQPAYASGPIPTSFDRLATRDWDLLGHHQIGLGGGVVKNLEPDDLGRDSPLASRNITSQDIPAHLAVDQGDLPPRRTSEEASNKQVTFINPVSNNDMDDSDMDGHHNERDPLVNWGSKISPYTAALDDPSSSYPHLPPVLEEPSSSFSEAADEDPLPAIEGVQISGEAFPGRVLQACGYSINGTTSCNFEWVRHLEDGSVNYIEGAKRPSYLVTADDVDTYLATEVQPLDNRKRMGELVKVFANEGRKITCDPDMHGEIEKTLYSGHVSYKVSLSTGYAGIWEPATLTIKREGYSIKCTGPSSVTEKFSPTTIVTIPYGNDTDLSIIGSGGIERFLRSDDSTEFNCSRDTIVLTMRLFIMKVREKKKGKKKGLFFNK